MEAIGDRQKAMALIADYAFERERDEARPSEYARVTR